MANPASELGRQYGLAQPLELANVTNRRLAMTLKEAGQEAEAMVKSNLSKGGFSSKVRAAQLQSAMQGVGGLSGQLWNAVGEESRRGIFQAAHLAADQQLDRDWLHGMPGIGVVQYAKQMHIRADAGAEAIIARAQNGIKLSERIYANGKATIHQVGHIVDQGLALQLSHSEIASRVRSSFRPDVPGGISYAARRLAVTEINNAHHRMTIDQGNDRPWVTGYKWNLSHSHPKPDICDQHARHNGNGIWAPKGVPGKPHPHCFCFLSVEMPEPDQFVNQIINGDHDGWLEGNGVSCPFQPASSLPTPIAAPKRLSRRR